MADSRLGEVRACGQAIWLRGFRRLLADSGRFADLMETAAVSGAATDLEVLAAAVWRGAEYLGPLERFAEAGGAGGAATWLLTQEAGSAARALLPIYEGSDGRDGLISVDIDPSLGDDAELTARAARDLIAAVGAPNVAIRLPPTSSGFAVFEALTADVQHVHIGPLFATGSVVRATEAFLRSTAGAATTVLPAFISFGLARLDAAVDGLLGRKIRAAGCDMSGAESLIGGSATAIAKVACRRQRDLLGAGGESPARLRLVWTDLLSADPRQPRERYVESLVGPDTVAVLDAVLLGAMMGRGEVDITLGQRVDEAEEFVAELAELDIDVEAIGVALEAEAVERRRSQYEELGRRVEAAARLVGGDPQRAAKLASSGTPWSASRAEIEAAPCEEVEACDAVARLWRKDASLWGADEETMELVPSRLGWLDAALMGPADHEPLRRFAAGLEDGEVEDVLLLGMGGSSLAAEVMRLVYESDRLRVLDSTVPAQIKATAGQVDPARTAVLVASKSGTTIEVRALFDWFYAMATPMLDTPGGQFAAITDPGTPLEQLAHERGFERLWLAPPDVGGRFSALTTFGILPMAVMGVDISAVLAAARRMAVSCSPEVAAVLNPAARLAAALHRAHEDGRDKITFVPSRSLAAFGLWAEQLVAESTGKQGRGLIPVVDEPADASADYGGDRLFVSMSLAGDDDRAHGERIDAIDAAGHPLLHFELEDRHELGAEFFRWQAAVSIAGALMGINPFDQPDVQASKDRTAALLAAHRDGRPMSDRAPLGTDTGWAVFADLERDEELAARQQGNDLESWLAAHLGRAAAPDYVGIQAFVAADVATYRSLQRLRRLLFERLGVATTLGWGPAFLHSTGQLHKGGPESGIFLQITADDVEDIEVPGAGYSFGSLVRAQSLGDLAALQERGRRVLRVHLCDAVAGTRDLLDAASRALS